MPNWCSNNLYVSGDLTRFKEWMQDEFLLNKIVPMPEELRKADFLNENSPDIDELKKKYGAYGWYDWRVQNWGTKWDVSEPTIVPNGSTSILISFATAWSPPQVAIQSLAEKFPELKIKLAYLEEGMGFVGYDIWEGGEYCKWESEDDSSTDEWKKIAAEEFGWEEIVEQ